MSASPMQTLYPACHMPALSPQATDARAMPKARLTRSLLLMGSRWTAAWQDWLARRRSSRRSQRDLHTLLALDPRALDDIGAPDWLREQAVRARGAQETRRQCEWAHMR